MSRDEITITEAHLKLLRRANVQWLDIEFGAPGLDPKRPYGNSSVLEDMHEILTGESIGCTDSERDSLTRGEEDRYAELHLQMRAVLQALCMLGDE